MSEPEHRPRENDHLVEPMYEALGKHPYKEGKEGGEPRGSGRWGCAALLVLLAAMLPPALGF